MSVAWNLIWSFWGLLFLIKWMLVKNSIVMQVADIFLVVYATVNCLTFFECHGFNLSGFDICHLEGVKNYKVGWENFWYWRIHQSKSLLIHCWVDVIFVGSSCPSYLILIQGAIICNLVEVCQILALILQFLLIKTLIQLLSWLAILISLEMNKLTLTTIY